MKSAFPLSFLLIAALPAAAQNRGSVAATVRMNSGGGMGGGFGGGIGAFSFSSQTASPTVNFPIIIAQGSEATFVPTRFVPYAEALKLGREALAYRPKTVAEVAAEYRALKAKKDAKPK